MTSKVAASRRLEGARTAARALERRPAPADPRRGILDLQRKVGNRAVHGLLGLPPVVDQVLKSGQGRGIDPSVRATMESRFGEDLSRVRVYTDPRASESAEALSAKAYSVGPNVVFGRNQYAPNTAEGRRLLAHELAHVIQQSRGGSVREPDANTVLEQAAADAGKAVSETQGPVAVAGASGVGLARARKGPKSPAISHFDDDLRTVVFNQPMSVEEATAILWRFPPLTHAITPDPEEKSSGGQQRRFHVDVRFELQYRPQVTDSFRRAAEAALPQADVVKQLRERGVPEDVARVAPTLPYEQVEITDVYDVSPSHARHARWERWWGGWTTDWETQPGRKEIKRVVDVLHEFPGVMTVHGKTFPANWLVRNRNGIIETWQLRPPLEAYIKAANGNEEIGRRRYVAAMTTQSYVVKYWEQGYPLRDAMDRMRAEVEIDFKSAVWGAAALTQSASGLSSLKPGLGVVHELSGIIGPKLPESTEGAKTGKASAEPVEGMAARLSEEAAPTSVRSRRQEKRAAGTGLRPPHMDVGNRRPPPEAVGKRVQATGTGADAPAAIPLQQTEKPGVSGGAREGGVIPLQAGKRTPGPKTSQGTKRQPAKISLPDPRQVDEESPRRVAPEPKLPGAQKPTSGENFTTAEENARQLLEGPTETAEALSELEARKGPSEVGKKETRYGVKKHSDMELAGLAGHAMEPHVVDAWAKPLQQEGFTVYRTDKPAGPNLQAPKTTGETPAAKPAKEFLPSWYEGKYQAYPERYSKLFSGEGPDAIAESSEHNIIVVFDVAPTYSVSHFGSKVGLAQTIADAFPQSRVYIQEGYWGEPTAGGGYIMLKPRLVPPSGRAARK